MPELPRYFAQPGLPSLRLPEKQDVWGPVFGAMAQLTEAMREKQLPIDAARNASAYDVAMEDLKNEVQAEPDPNNWRDVFIRRETELRKGMLESVADPRVRNALSLHVERNLGRHIIDVSDRGIKASHVKQLEGILTVGNALALQAAQSSDESIRQGAVNTYNAMIASASQPTIISGRAVPGAIDAKQATLLREKFQVDVLKNRMEMLALSQDPLDQMKLTNENLQGVYSRVPPDDRARMLERSRTHQESLIAKIERDKNEVKRLVHAEWSGRANYGLLSNTELDRALKNEHPFISPDQARTLKSINDNPPTGQGSDAVRAIVQEYHSGPSTFERIKGARARLNALTTDLGKANPLVDKALNELQTDERTMTGIEASRVNRDIKAAQDEYDANTPKQPAFMDKLFGNQRQQDKAKIAEAVRKGQNPKDVVKQKNQEQKNRAEGVPDDVKHMRKALGQ